MLAGAAAGMLLARLDLHLATDVHATDGGALGGGWYTIHLNGRALISRRAGGSGGIVSGLAPALEAMRVNLAEQLKAGSRTGTGGRSPS